LEYPPSLYPQWHNSESPRIQVLTQEVSELLFSWPFSQVKMIPDQKDLVDQDGLCLWILPKDTGKKPSSSMMRCAF
jgi:hypothetical protein